MAKANESIDSLLAFLDLHGFNKITFLSQRHVNVSIYLAHKNGLGYIVKVLNKTNKNTDEQNRIKNESRFSFDILGLPKITDFIDNNECSILIRTYVSGVTLPSFWKKVKRKDRIKTLKLLISQLVPLFSELKRSNVLHLDIKPTNILISQGEKGLEAHLIDFGLARIEEESANKHTYFPLGYAAPELVLNQLDMLDHRTDLFSLGVCIWELLEKHIPFTHPNPLIMTNLQLNLPLPEGNNIPASLLALLHKMTNKYRFLKPPNQMDKSDVRHKLQQAMDQRYSDLSEFQSDLNELPEKRHWLVKLLSKP
jgi:serine/threonine protein kinase